MKKLKLILTYDHELPLGGWNSSFNSCIFDQTDKIFRIANELKVPVTLFTDILCAYRFKEWDYQGFYVPYKNQLIEAVTSGHDAQLHLHPHWLTTQYEGSSLLLSSDFKLADFDKEKDGFTIESIIKCGIDLLHEICKPKFNDYKCIAYRAGGFNLAPCTDRIINSLYSNGIRFDSSINKGFYYKSAISTVDYRNLTSLLNWTIPLSGNLFENGLPGIYEVPIAGVQAGLLTNLKHIYRKRAWKSRRPAAIGKSIHSGKSNLIDKLKFVFSTRMLSFDLYTLTTRDLLNIVKSELNNIDKSDSDTVYLTAISHPKLMGDYNFQLMKEFIVAIKNNFAADIEFITFQQAWNELKHNF